MCLCTLWVVPESEPKSITTFSLDLTLSFKAMRYCGMKSQNYNVAYDKDIRTHFQWKISILHQGIVGQSSGSTF